MPDPHSTSSEPRLRAYRGSAMLRSSLSRAVCVLPVVLFLWGLTGWAMQWW